VLTVKIAILSVVEPCSLVHTDISNATGPVIMRTVKYSTFNLLKPSGNFTYHQV
jgi:hypothetical protein